MNQALYARRYKEHIAHAKTLYATKDYVQAGEKLWGALSSLINSRTTIEKKGVNEKRYAFLSLFSVFLSRAPGYMMSQMREVGFRKGEEIFDVMYALHGIFYGGTNYSDSSFSHTMPFLISLIEQL